MLRTYDVKYKKFGFDDSFDVIKCLQQIDCDLLNMSANCNEHPSNIKPMVFTGSGALYTVPVFYCLCSKPKVIRKFFIKHNKSFRWHLGDYEKHIFFPF